MFVPLILLKMFTIVVHIWQCKYQSPDSRLFFGSDPERTRGSGDFGLIGEDVGWVRPLFGGAHMVGRF